MERLSFMLISNINTESPGSINYEISKYLLDHLRNLKDCSINDLAEQCNVSKATISRFCRSIGISGFKELRNELYASEFYGDRLFDYTLCSGQETDYLLSTGREMAELHQALDYNQIRSLAAHIRQYQNVAVWGHMDSYLSAKSLQLDLYRIGKIVLAHEHVTTQLNFLKNCNEDTLIIIFSRRGEFLNRIIETEAQKKLLIKPRVYLITGNNKKTKDEYFNHVIYIPNNHSYSQHPIKFIAVAKAIALSYIDYCKEIGEYPPDFS